VNAAVGSPGAMHPDILAAEGLESPLEGALDGRQVGLGLEAPEGTTVIFHGETIARHQLSF
jgi:hypothetical protein